MNKYKNTNTLFIKCLLSYFFANVSPLNPILEIDATAVYFDLLDIITFNSDPTPDLLPLKCRLLLHSGTNSLSVTNIHFLRK